MAVKIGNIRLKGDDGAGKQSARSAEKRKASANETIEEAWERIMQSKSYRDNKAQLDEVKAAMEAGEIGREPVPEGKKQKKFSAAEAKRLYKVLQRKKREQRLREMVDNTPDNYWLVTDVPKLDELCGLLDGEDEIVFDVESTGTDVWTDYIVGHVITAIKADVHAYIPTKHESQEKQLDNDYVVDKLRPYYEDESLGKLAHNAKFDIHMLDREGVRLKGLTWDTQEAMKVLNENEPSFALKNLVTKYLGIQSETYGDLFGQVGFDEVSDLRVALAYAAKDGDVTRKLRDFQRKHLQRFPEMYDYYTQIEVPLISVVQQMESTGFDIDTDFAEEYGKEMKADIDSLESKLLTELGDINLNSPAQLKPALERKLGRSLESTDAKKVLKPLSSEFPIVKTLLEYKELVKLYSTYISVLPDLIDEKSGKLHTNFNQNGARTGRFSSGGSGVNLQNQAKEARKLFTAPEGYVILGGDWSQQEYRCLAYFTQEPKLVENYLQGRDIYSQIASEVFGKPYEECGDGSQERKMAKVILLAVAYGTGPKTLAMQMGKTEKEAKQFLDNFFKQYTKVTAWKKHNEKFVDRHGFVWMDGKQRKRRLPAAKDRRATYGQKSSAHRQATNARVQGSAAIQTKATMIELQKLCDRKTAEGRGEWRLWCVVHDEALLLVPDIITRQDVKDFEDVMLHSYVFGNVPNKTDIELYRRWGDGISIDEWFAGR